MPSSPSPLLIFTAVCASLAFLLYNRNVSSSSPSNTTQNNDPTTNKREKKKGEITYKEEPYYFPFTEFTPGKMRMGVKRMAADAWIEIGSTFPTHLALKKEILKNHRDLVWVSREAESTEKAKREVFDMLVKYLPENFPEIFELKDGHIHNHATGDVWKVEGELDRDPFEIANMLIQEDLCIMEQEGDQQ